ncbi:MAG: hypothetical protein IT290_11130, partial [Deltaproteobacteria bacterium]|nr:hypothetical protein [Deltaproteobacteria bacterium]
LCSALLMTAVFVYPLWRIELYAPQYPEGLFLKIWIDKIAGDVRNVNILNHYIGMSKIEPENIPELRYFPMLFKAFACTGVIVALLNRRLLGRVWCFGVLLFAVLGLYDFYSWEYRFGHELSDDAPMKLEESYMPPLIGTKQLLSITVNSWPEHGGYAFSASALIAGFVLGASLLRRGPA